MSVDDARGVDLSYPIGRRIRAVRQRAKTSQEEFAKRIGVSQSYLSDVETGKNKPNVEMVSGIVSAYHSINPVWLLTGDGDVNVKSSANAPLADIDHDALEAGLALLAERENRIDYGVSLPVKAAFLKALYIMYVNIYENSVSKGSSKDNARNWAKYHLRNFAYQFDLRTGGISDPDDYKNHTFSSPFPDELKGE